MKIGQLSQSQLDNNLKHEGLFFKIGPFVIHLSSPLDLVTDNIHLLYSEYDLVDSAFADFHIQITSPALRKWLRPQSLFSFDGFKPFKPLPQKHAFAFFEWGLNWCVAQYAHQYLIIHSAVIEKQGNAMILPGVPGAGKSTLCAAMVNRGWRLLSDEFALIDLSTLQLIPMTRPVSLKNESIDIIQQFEKNAAFGPLIKDTSKGTIAHMKPAVEHVKQMHVKARPAWFVFPEYSPKSKSQLKPLKKTRSFMQIVENSFNYSVLGKQAFVTLSQVIDQCDSFELSYSHLDEAIETLDELANQPVSL